MADQTLNRIPDHPSPKKIEKNVAKPVESARKEAAKHKIKIKAEDILIEYVERLMRLLKELNENYLTHF